MNTWNRTTGNRTAGNRATGKRTIRHKTTNQKIYKWTTFNLSMNLFLFSTEKFNNVISPKTKHISTVMLWCKAKG